MSRSYLAKRLECALLAGAFPIVFPGPKREHAPALQTLRDFIGPGFGRYFPPLWHWIHELQKAFARHLKNAVISLFIFFAFFVV